MKENKALDKYLISLGKEIAKRRLQMGLSQEELAVLSGLHRTYVSEIERGKRSFSIGCLIAIAHVFEMTPLELTELVKPEPTIWNQVQLPRPVIAPIAEPIEKQDIQRSPKTIEPQIAAVERQDSPPSANTDVKRLRQKTATRRKVSKERAEFRPPRFSNMAGCFKNVWPDLAAEWHSELNGSKRPENFFANSREKVWWQCRRNAKHVWSCTIVDRVTRKRPCPRCI